MLTHVMATAVGHSLFANMVEKSSKVLSAGAAVAGSLSGLVTISQGALIGYTLTSLLRFDLSGMKKKCFPTFSPGVYAKVGRVLNWIREQTQDSNYCVPDLEQK